MKINALSVATKERPKAFCIVVNALFSLAVAVVIVCLLSATQSKEPKLPKHVLSSKDGAQRQTVIMQRKADQQHRYAVNDNGRAPAEHTAEASGDWPEDARRQTGHQHQREEAETALREIVARIPVPL